jgi:pimeloyl-ACP methyl ester carboxylesterase
MNPEPHTPTITVVAVHGNGGGAFRFDRLKGHIPPGIDLQAITLPGFGRAPKNPSLRTISDYGDHLATVCRQFDHPVLLGHGIGGSISLDMTQRHRDAISGLILNAPVGARLDTRRFPQLMRIPGAKMLVQKAMCNRLIRPILKKKFFAPDVPSDFLDEFFEEYRHCSVFGEMFDIITPTWFSGLQPVDVRTVVWWGENERVLGADQAEAFLSVLPRGRVILEPGWDHFPMVERPQEYATRLAELVSELTVSRPSS